MQNPCVQLKKIANHPYLIHMPIITGTNKILVDENIIKVSGKFQVLDAMLPKLKLLGHKVIQIKLITNTKLCLIYLKILIYITFYIIVYKTI